MSLENVVSSIDAEIARLQQARAVLAGTHEGTRVGRSTASSTDPKKGRRKLSAAARKKMSEAQRKRWAATKKATA